MWRRWPIRDNFAFFDTLTFKNTECSPFWYQFLIMIFTVGQRFPVIWCNDQSQLTFRFLSKCNCSRDFSQNSWILWFSRFKQICNSRKTTCNIFRTSCFLRNSCYNLPNFYLFSIRNIYASVRRQGVVSRHG